MSEAERAARRESRWRAEAMRDYRVMIRKVTSLASQRARAVLLLADDCGLPPETAVSLSFSAFMVAERPEATTGMEAPEIVGLRCAVAALERHGLAESQAGREFVSRALGREVKP